MKLLKVVFVALLWTIAVKEINSQCAGLVDSYLTTSITQYGITITFSASVRVGHFSNGDFWILAPVTIISTTPSFNGTTHGYQLNPTSFTQQGYDYRVSGWNSSLVPSLPLTITTSSTFIKAFSHNITMTRPVLKTAIAITILTSIPSGDGHITFRPGYFGSSALNPRTPRLISEINRSALPMISNISLSSQLPLSEIEQNYQRVQLDHLQDWVADNMHPSENMPNYGASIAAISSTATSRLIFGDVIENSCALIRFIQVGIDYYSVMKGGMIFPANGGHCLGRKSIIIFASIALQDTEMQEFVKTKTTEGAFHEDTSIILSANNVPLWGALGCGTSEDAYWNVIRTGNGCKTYTDPYKLIDGGPIPGGAYDFCCNHQPNKGPALLMFFSPLARKIWNNENFYKFVSRWVTFGTWTQPDNCAPIVGTCGDGASCSSSKSCVSGSCTYDTGALYKIKYGPDGNGGCIKDKDSSDGIGRFPQRHGKDKNGGYYGSDFTNDVWDTYWHPDSNANSNYNPTGNSDEQNTNEINQLKSCSMVLLIVLILIL